MATCAIGLVCPCCVIPSATSQIRLAGATAASQRSVQSPKVAVVLSGTTGTAAGRLTFGASLDACARASAGTKQVAVTTNRRTRCIRLLHYPVVFALRAERARPAGLHTRF